jgi:hypothetical protein
MTACPVIMHIWVYGWLAGDEVEVLAASSDRDVLEHYLASPAFHTSFLPSDMAETGIHGPLFADRIAATDFAPFEEAALDGYLKALLYRAPTWQSPQANR